MSLIISIMVVVVSLCWKWSPGLLLHKYYSKRRGAWVLPVQHFLCVTCTFCPLVHNVNLCTRTPQLRMFLWIYSVCDPFPSNALPLSPSLPIWLGCSSITRLSENQRAWGRLRDIRERWKMKRERKRDVHRESKEMEESTEMRRCREKVTVHSWFHVYVGTAIWQLRFICHH